MPHLNFFFLLLSIIARFLKSLMAVLFFRHLLVFAFFLGLPFWVLAQQTPYFFYAPGEKEGLNLHSVRTMVQDTKGNIWLGTQHGIVRFDGLHTRLYQQYLNSDSVLSGYLVNDSDLAPDGKVWFGHFGGFTYWDPAKSNLINLPGAVLFLKIDSRNRICYANYDGLFLRNSQGKVFPIALNGPSESLESNPVSVYRMFNSPDRKSVWVQTSQHFYEIFLGDTSARVVHHPWVKNLESQGAKSFYPSKENKFWVLDHQTRMVSKFDPKTGSLGQERIYLPTAMVNGFFSLKEDQTGNLWVLNQRSKVIYYDATLKEVVHLNPSPSDGCFPRSRILSLIESKDQTVWLGTESGLVAFNPKQNWLSVRSIFVQTDTSAQKPRIRSMKYLNGYYWLGCTYGRLVKYDPKTSKRESFFIPDEFSSVPTGEPKTAFYSIFALKQNLLIGTQNGLVVFDTRTNRWFKDPRLSGPEWDPYLISQMILQTDSLLWIRLHGYGFNRLNLNSFEFEKFGNGTDFLDTTLSRYWEVGEGKDNSIAFFLADKFKVAKPKSSGKEFSISTSVKATKKDLGDFSCFSYTDGKEYFWRLVFPLGPYQLHIPTGKYEPCLPLNQSDFNMFKACILGKDNRLWLADHNAIGILDPKTRTYQTINLKLGSSEGLYDIHFEELPDGKLAFHNYYELVFIDPFRFNFQLPENGFSISEIRVNNQEINFEEQVVDVDPENNSVDIHLGFLFPHIDPFVFEYSFEGTDEWLPLDQSKMLKLIGLGNGLHPILFRVRTKDNLWVSQVKTVKLNVLPFFYETWWFWTLLVGIVVLLVFLYLQSKWKARDAYFALESKALNLEKEKTIIQYESLKQQLNPHFLFNSLTSLGSLIRIDTKMATTFLDAMSKSYRYILKSQDHETVPLVVEIKFVETFITLQKVRFDEALQVKITVSEENLHLKIVPVTIQNLIENAIKHNIVDADSPLIIEILVENGFLLVRNNLQRKSFVETSNKRGLADLQSLYKYLDNRPVTIEESEEFFQISIPLI